MVPLCSGLIFLHIASLANIHGPSKAAWHPGSWGLLGIWFIVLEGASESDQGQTPDARQIQEQITQSGGNRCQERGHHPRWALGPELNEPEGQEGLPQIQEEWVGLLALICGLVVVSCSRPGPHESTQRDGKEVGLVHMKSKATQVSFLGQGYLFSHDPSLDNHLSFHWSEAQR